jgi:hypothetical protein
MAAKQNLQSRIDTSALLAVRGCGKKKNGYR